jgi:predicted SAM-dependent methyltransferase
MQKRYKLLRSNISKEHKGLEIGPFYHPVVRKADGWQITVVDILSREDLIKSVDRQTRYNHPTAVDNIENVDIVWDWKNKSLEEEVINKIGGNLDYIISSHSIEHVVDILGFVKSCSNLLKVGGVFNLAVPDLRYTFDFFRSPSTLGQVLSVHNNKPKRHSSEVYLDAISNQGYAGGLYAWRPDSDHEKVTLLNQKLEDSWKMYQDNLLSEKHTDCHNWVFTPCSFKLLFFDLWTLGIIDLTVRRMYEEDFDNGSEFCVQLEKRDRIVSIPMKTQEIHEYRSKLLSNIVIELAERVKIGKLQKENV